MVHFTPGWCIIIPFLLLLTWFSDFRHQDDGGPVEEQGAVDALESALRQVVSDIGEYYEKKIQMLQIRADRHRASRPPPGQVELAERLQLVYKGHPNYHELWTDMFARMTGTHGQNQVGEEENAVAQFSRAASDHGYFGPNIE